MHGGWEGHLDEHGDSGASELERPAAAVLDGRDPADAAMLLVLAIERPECRGHIGRQRCGRSAPQNLAPPSVLVVLGVVRHGTVHHRLGHRAFRARRQDEPFIEGFQEKVSVPVDPPIVSLGGQHGCLVMFNPVAARAGAEPVRRERLGPYLGRRIP
jgi:hypothetical protein